MHIRTLVLPRLLFTASAIAVALISAPTIAGQNAKESFTGFAINMNSGPSTATVDFTIERWSTEAERQR